MRCADLITIEVINRYSGELKIILKDLLADKRGNVVGKIPKNEYILAAEIKPG